MNTVGLGFKDSAFGTVGEAASNVFMKPMLPVGLALGGVGAASSLADEFMNGTPLGEGFGVAAMNVYASARLGVQGIMDSLHITDAAKYLEDLMPGSINSPIAGAARGIGPALVGIALGRKFGPRAASRGGIIGAAVGALVGGLPLGAYGEWDIRKIS